MLRVVDAYAGGRGWLEVRVLGSVRVARATGPELDRGEAMRYLAEIVWAPDAILANRDLVWTDPGGDWITVALGTEEGAPEVRFRLDAAGDFVEIRAEDRPATGPEGGFVLRDWEGHFSDYERIGPRRVPRRGEVGYVCEDGYEAYWRGEISGLEVVGGG